MQNEFDKYSTEYLNIIDNSINKLSEYDAEYYQEFKIKCTKTNIQAVEKILDFGCGIGIGCKYLKKHFPNADITGIDNSYENIKQAQKQTDCNFIHYDGENLPFENEFDLIYAACVFHHIDKDRHSNLIKQLKKALKKGGKIFIFEHNPLNPITKNIVKNCVLDKNAKLIFPKEFKNLTDCKINYILFIPRFKLFEKFFSFEKYLTKLPLGAQYYCIIEKHC